MKLCISSSVTRVSQAFLLCVGLLVAGITGLIPTQAANAAGVVTVSTSGTDNTSCGAVDTPCATIGQAVTNAAADDTIMVGAGIFFPPSTPSETALFVDKNLTIQGQGPANTMIYRSGTARRIFDVTGGTLTLKNLTIWNGAATGDAGGGVKVSNGASLILDGVAFKDNRATNGAGVYVVGGGNLTVTNTTFTGNIAATNGGAIYMAEGGTLSVTNSTFGGSGTANQAVNGAAIYLADSDGSISAGSFLNNAASGSGGAIYLTGSTTSLDIVNGTKLSSNSAAVDGGAIHQAGGTLTLTNATLSNNTAGSGAGVFQSVGSMVVSGSTFSANTASTSGAALYLASTSGGNMLKNSTLSGNTANGTQTTDGGGAIFKSGASTLSLDSLTIAYNTAARNANSGVRVVSGSGMVTTVNTLFYANGSGTTHANCSGTLWATDESNLDSGTTCGFSSSRSSLDPKLSPLADNGGLTFTHALPYKINDILNPAIDNGSTSLLTDQRGKARAELALDDVGAYEFEYPAISLNTEEALTYTELDAATPIAPSATYSDGVMAYTSDDTLTVTLSGAQSGDVLGIKTTSKIQTVKSGDLYYVLYDGLTNVGTLTGAKYQAVPDSTPLVVTFTNNASRIAIEYLLRAITFENTQVNPDTAARSAAFLIEHGDVSSETVSRAIAVSNPNLSPFVNDFSATLNENEALTINNFGELYTDADLNGMASFMITELPLHGALKINGVALEEGDLGNPVNTGTSVLEYTPTTSYFGNDSFTWQAVDDDSAPATSNVATYSFTIVAVNDSPTTNGQTTKALAAVNEDLLTPPGAAVSDLIESETIAFDDADGTALAGIGVVANAANADQGTWQFSANGGISWTNLPAAIGAEVDDTVALVLERAGMLRFVPTADWNGTPGSLTLRVWDGTAGQVSGTSGVLRDISSLVGGTGSYSSETLTLTSEINAVNDDPTAVLLSATTLAENLPIGTTVATISAEDVDLETNPATETMTYSLLAVGDYNQFIIVGTELQTTAIFDYESMTPDGEGNKTYSISLQASDGTATVTTAFIIVVSDDVLTVSAAGGTASESASPKNGQITLSLSKSYPYPVTVTFETSASTADGSDYTLSDVSETVIAAGEVSKAITVNVLNDDQVEGEESVVLTLIGTNSADVSVAAGSGATAAVTISDDDTSAASIIATTPTAVEGEDAGQFRVSLTQLAKTDTVINYSLGGTAANGSDYTSLGSGSPEVVGTVTIPANQPFATIDVAAGADGLVEGDQTVVLTLTGTNNSAISASGSATVTITETETATISITGTKAAGEPTTTGEFTVTINPPAEQDVTIALGIGTGSVAGPTDYEALPSSVTIPAGQSSVKIPVGVMNDIYDEYNELLFVELGTISGSGSFTLDVSSASILINDEDALPKISINDAFVDPEGADGAATAVKFTVTLDRPTEKDVQINYLTADGSATPDVDYTSLTGSHAINTSGHETSFSFDVMVNGDDLVEGEETFDVDLFLVNTENAVFTHGIGNVTISDDDTAAASIANSISTTDEGSLTLGQFTVTLTKPVQVPVVISYAVSGDAASGSDYTALPGSLTIPANTLTANIDLTSLADELVETDEVVAITLLSTDNVGVSIESIPELQTAEVTISDDDAAVVRVSALPDSTTEGSSTPATLTFSIDKQSQQDVMVTYDVAGSATATNDYLALPGTIVIPALTSSIEIDLSASDDGVVEGDEVVQFAISGTDNGDVSIPSDGGQLAEITFHDNDSAVISIVTSQSAAENGAETPADGMYTVSMSSAARSDVTIAVTLGGTAVEGTDYAALLDTITIPAGETLISIPIGITEDLLVEGDETVILSLSNPQPSDGLNSSLFTISEAESSASLTITDDDTATLTVAASTTPVAEGGTNGTFTITASKASQADVLIAYAVDGSAGNGSDYTDGTASLSGEIILPANQTSVMIPVSVVDDDSVEGTETVQLTLNTPTEGRVVVDSGSGGSDSLDIQDNDQAVIWIEKLADTGEDDAAASFQILVDKSSQADLPVTFSLGGTADSTGDYLDYSLSSADGVLAGTTLTLPGGSNSALLTVTPIGDELVEGIETLTVSLIGPTTGLASITTEEAQVSASMAIADNDTATLTVAASGDPSENGATGVFTISTDRISQSLVMLGYDLSGTAANSSDYTSGGAALSGSVTLPAFASSVEIPLTVVNDALVEDSEAVILTLTSPDSGLVQVDTGGGESASLSILDNDTATISVQAAATPAEGGAAGSFVVSVSKASQSAVAVTYALGGNAASGDDYSLVSPDAQSLTSSVVTLAPGALSAQVQINPVDDNLVEGTESLILMLTDPKTGSVKVGTPNNATLNLTDNDSAIVSVAQTADAAEDGDFGRFTLSSCQPLAADLTVTFSVSGSADPTGIYQDFSLTSTNESLTPTTIVLTAGEQTAAIDVVSVNDAFVEPTENIILTLTETSNALATISTETNSSATVALTDNDLATVSIAPMTATLAEADANLQLTVTATQASQQALTVTYTVDGTALAGTDFNATDVSSESVTLPGYATQATVELIPVQDNLVEGQESLTVSLEGTDFTKASIASDGTQVSTITLTDDDSAELSLAATQNPAAENGAGTPTDGAYSLTLSHPARANVTVAVAVSGTAESGADYAALAPTATILAGETTQTIDLSVIEDALVEGDESVLLTISNLTTADGLDSGLFSITADNAGISITDDDTALVSLVKTTDAGEPDSNGAFTVSVDKVSQEAVTLTYAVDETSTATAGSDYSALNGQVVIPGGASSASIPVPVVDDTIAEDAETLSLSLTGALDERVSLDTAQQTAVLTISSDDADPIISASAVSVTEGSGGSSTASFTVALDRDSQKGVSVAYATQDGTAVQPGDYSAAAGSLTMGNGVTSAVVDVTIVGDELVEGDESFEMVLDQAVNATLSNGEASLTVSATVEDDDSASVSVAKTQDGAEPATNGQFTLTLSHPVQVDTSITYTTSGTATAGTDYTALSGTVTIPAGQTSQTIAVAVKDDAIDEFNETVQVELSSASGLVSLDSTPAALTATLSLADNEVDPQISINDVSVIEGDSGTGSATFSVTLNRLSEKGVTVQYRTTNGTAVSPDDYQAASGSLSFGAAELTKSITVEVVGDAVVEVDKNYNLVLESPSNASLNKGVGTGTIVENDTSVVRVESVENAAEQDLAAGTFSLVLTNAIENDLSVTYSVMGSAAGGTDYTSLNGTATILAGSLTQTIAVTPIEDALIEGDESVVITLSGVDNSRVTVDGLEANRTAELTLNDNDTAEVSVSASTATTEEGSAIPGQFTVGLTTASQSPVVVDYTITGSAEAGNDYDPLAGSITIPALATSTTIDVATLEDGVVEGHEEVTIELTGTHNPSVSLVATPEDRTASLTITDNDTAQVSLSVDPINTIEGGPTAGSFIFTLDQLVQTDVAVFYSVSGNATPTDDYAALSGSVVIPALTLSAQVDVAAIDDLIVEGGETISLTIGGTNNIRVAVNTLQKNGDLSVEDNDAASVSIAKTLDAAEPGTNGEFTLTMSNAAQADTILAYSVAGTAAAGTDYTALSGTLTILAGETSQSIFVAAKDDLVAEYSETIQVSLDSVSGLVTLDSNEANLTATLNLADDDADPIISASAVSVTEGSGGNSTASFTVALDRDSQKGVSVAYATQDGTAVQPGDYSAAAGSLTLGNGVTSAVVDVTIVGDELVEGDESFEMVLDQAVNATLSNGEASLTVSATVEDDDSASVSVAKTQDGAEPATNGQFTLTLSHPVQVDTSITYTTSGTATAGTDYTALSGTVTIPAQTTTAAFNVPVLNDAVAENAETVIVTLTEADAAVGEFTISADYGSASLSIADDEMDPQISIQNVSQSEAAGTFTFNVTLDRASEKGITVNYMTASSTAGDYSDFTPVAGSLTFDSTHTSLPVVVTVIDDSLIEGEENFTVVLEDQTNAVLLKASAIGTIQDNDFAIVSVAATTPAEEDETNGVFTVSIAPTLDQDVQVTYMVEAASTATSTADYSTLSGLVTIPAGVSSAVITVATLADSLVEGPETIQLSLTGVSTPLSKITDVAADKTAQLTIIDDDLGQISISASAPAAAEPTTDGEFTIHLDHPTQSALAVTYTIGGTAAVGEDYTALTGTATIPAFESSVLVPVDVLDNSLPENAETVILALTGPNNSLFSVDPSAERNTATVTISDDDADPTISVAPAQVAEGDAGSTTLTFDITLSQPSAKTGSIDYVLEDVSATAGEDYVAGSGTLTFNPGETSQSVDVTVFGDLVPEADETFILRLSNANNLVILEDNGIGTILDNDTPELSIDSVTLAEGNSGTTDFIFTVTLSPASTETVTVDYATSDDLASAGSDYTAGSGSLTFTPLEATKTITIPVNGDVLFETDETFLVTLSHVSENAVISTSAYQGTGTIQNDEDQPRLTIEPIHQAEGASGTSIFTFTVMLDPANVSPVSVAYATLDGTAATAAGDYLETSGTLTYAPGKTSQTISVTINGDRLAEADETFEVELSEATHASLVGDAERVTATGTIDNDDHAPNLAGSVSLSVDEDQPLSFTSPVFTDAFTDADSDSLAAVTILSLPSNGTLKLNASAIQLNAVIAAVNLNKLVYTPAADYNGSDSFAWTASDGINLASTASQFMITVNPVNDAPTLSEIGDIAIIRNTPNQEIQLSGISAGGDGEIADLDVSAHSDNPAVLPDPLVTYRSADNTWNLSLHPTGAAGIAHVSVMVDDRGGSNNLITQSFTVEIENPSLVLTAASGLVTAEGGGAAHFSVSLGVRPLETVTLSLVSTNPAEGQVAPASLVFTPDNWNTPQEVTITGVDDTVLDGDVSYQIILDASGSDDSQYRLLEAHSVAVVNRDDEVDRTDFCLYLPLIEN